MFVDTSCISTSVPQSNYIIVFQIIVLLTNSFICLQNVVPPPLLDHYISMTEQTKAQTIDTELPRHCAYTFPGAVLALGKDNWHCLKETYELLASNMQVQIHIFYILIIFDSDLLWH